MYSTKCHIIIAIIQPLFAFNVELCELQLLLVAFEEEVKVLPGDLLLGIKPGSLEHGLNDLLGLALRQAAAGDLREGPEEHRDIWAVLAG